MLTMQGFFCFLVFLRFFSIFMIFICVSTIHTYLAINSDCKQIFLISMGDGSALARSEWHDALCMKEPKSSIFIIHTFLQVLLTIYPIHCSSIPTNKYVPCVMNNLFLLSNSFSQFSSSDCILTILAFISLSNSTPSYSESGAATAATPTSSSDLAFAGRPRFFLGSLVDGAAAGSTAFFGRPRPREAAGLGAAWKTKQQKKSYANNLMNQQTHLIFKLHRNWHQKPILIQEQKKKHTDSNKTEFSNVRKKTIFFFFFLFFFWRPNNEKRKKFFFLFFVLFFFFCLNLDSSVFGRTSSSSFFRRNRTGTLDIFFCLFFLFRSSSLCCGNVTHLLWSDWKNEEKKKKQKTKNKNKTKKL